MGEQNKLNETVERFQAFSERFYENQHIQINTHKLHRRLRAIAKIKLSNTLE